MEPARKIIALLGGPTAVSKIAGVHRTRVSSWMRAKRVGGTGGTIPINHINKLIEAAGEIGVFLSGDDFLPVPETKQGRAA